MLLLNCYSIQGDFSLLFHAVVRGNLEAFEILLRAGAEPEWRNRVGATILNLIAKRCLTDWADQCITLPPNMTQARIELFVNQGSHNGK